MQVKPKKSLGQHFLHDQNIARKIVDSIIGNPKMVFEIGPGMGVISSRLAEKFNNYKAIEIDKESTQYLIKQKIVMPEQLIQGDFLNYPIENVLQKGSCIIGNFPYNISSQIFFRVLEQRNTVQQVVGMVQWEVAQRIAANCGNKTYGILSVLLQAYYNVEILFKIGPQVFTPAPKVQSAVIRLIRNEVKLLPCNESLFFDIVKAAFNQRRKMLRNALKRFYSVEQLSMPVFEKRAEQLSVNEFINLTVLAQVSCKSD